jgi:diguanylate cyclase (GGDEF)-like protein
MLLRRRLLDQEGGNLPLPALCAPNGRRRSALSQGARALSLGVALLAFLLTGIWTAVKTTTDHLLYEEATSAAQSWAHFLVDNVKDLKEIASGEQPESSSMTFFQLARNAGPVFRYEVFNREGYSQLVADRHKIISVNISDYSADAARSAAIQAPLVSVREGSPGMPAFFAEAYVPVLVGGEPIAVVAAYVDQAAQHKEFKQTFIALTLSLGLVMALAFGVPAAAWYRRSKEKFRADAELHFLAHHDGLTGLCSRAFFTEQLAERLDWSRRADYVFAVLALDLDGFKHVNDTRGHPTGDALLRAVAERIRASVRDTDVVARLGGDEFAVLATSYGDPHEAVTALAARLLDVISAPYDIDGRTVEIGISIGAALAPAHGEAPDALLTRADVALYSVKSAGKNAYRIFEPALEREAHSRIALAADLRDTLLDGGVDVDYQVVVDAATGEALAVEALARWRHAQRGLVPPDVFIPIAEDTGLVVELGELVLRQACRDAGAWPQQIKLSVNLSPVQFARGRLIDMVERVLGEVGLPPARLELEITESVLLQNEAHNLATLHALKALGVSIALDDFGTGASSLSYMRMFPFDKIKVEKALVAEMAVRPESAAIICAVAGLARMLGIQCTAEGVETEQQRDLLRAAGCTQLQGYLFGRPRPAAQLGAVLRARQFAVGVADQYDR